MGSNRIIDEFRPKPKPRRKRPQVEIPLVLSALGGGVTYTGEDEVYVEGTVGMFAPPSLPGLTANWKADTQPFDGTPDGDEIGLVGNPWFDDYAAVPATRILGVPDGLNPKYKTNVIGVKPAILWDNGAGLGRVLSFAAFNFAGDFTFIIIASTAINGYTQWLCNVFDLGHASTRNWQFNPPSVNPQNNLALYDGGVNSPPLELDGSYVSGSGAINLGPALVHPSTDLTCMVYRRSGATVSFRENKTNQISTTDVVRTYRMSGMGNSILDGDAPKNNYLAEIIIYNQFQSDGSLDSLYDRYLKPRWVTLP